MGDSDFRGPDDPVVRALWITTITLMVGGGLAVWGATELLAPRSTAQLVGLLGGAGAFGVGMVLTVVIAAREAHGPGRRIQGRAGSATEANAQDPVHPTSPPVVPPAASAPEPLHLRFPHREAEIRSGIRNAWILGWALVLTLAVPVPLMIAWLGFDGPEWIESPPGLLLVFATLTAIALGGASRNASNRRTELRLIRQDPGGTELILDDVGVRAGVALLLGDTRSEVRKRGRAVLHLPWSAVERWEVLPGAPGGSGRKGAPPQYRITRWDGSTVSFERTDLGRREAEVLGRVRAAIRGEIVLRDDLLEGAPRAHAG